MAKASLVQHRMAPSSRTSDQFLPVAGGPLGIALLAALGCASGVGRLARPGVDPVARESSADVDLGEEASAWEPQSQEEQALELHREALGKCQEAAGLIKQGEVAAAIQHIDAAYALLLEMGPAGSETLEEAQENMRLLVAKLINQAHGSQPTTGWSPPASWDLGLPMVDNEHVRREIVSLTTVELPEFLAAYRRAGRYRPMIQAKLTEAGLPSQLSWLPLVESWFKTSALSRAGALGLWQFIASTGLRYGLSRDAWVDERLDPEKATAAALAYLTDLHRIFGDWPKALAAYNCGEARVLRLQRDAAQQGEYADFWDLYAGLPKETRRYFPRLVATLQIIEDPGRYSVELPQPEAPFSDVSTVRLERSVKLSALEVALGLEEGTLAVLNPELRHRATPKRSHAFRVPSDRSAEVVTAAHGLPEWELPKPRYFVHRVRSGQTLSTIARRYRTSVATIMRLNRIRDPNRIWRGQRLRIPVRR